MATDADRANHEASHAVAWWWWVHRPDGQDPAFTDGWFEEVTLEPRAKRPDGHFCPGKHVGTEGDVEWATHMSVMALAGPVSDELRGMEWPGAGAVDIPVAEFYVSPCVEAGSLSSVEGFITALRSDVTALLHEPVVLRMVSDLESALLKHRTLDYVDALPILAAAAKD